MFSWSQQTNGWEEERILAHKQARDHHSNGIQNNGFPAASGTAALVAHEFWLVPNAEGMLVFMF